MIIVDFSYPIDILKTIKDSCATLTVFDHHATAREAVEAVGGVFDNNRSGAVIAWEELRPFGDYIPRIVYIIEDRDLWRWKLPETRAVTLALRLECRTVEDYAYYMTGDKATDDERLHALRLRGQAYEYMQERQIADATETAPELFLAPDGVIPLPCIVSTVHVSDVGNQMVTKFDIPAIAILSGVRDGKAVFSLRANGGVNVGEWAKDAASRVPGASGGGHANAAGVSFPAHCLGNLLQPVDAIRRVG